MPLLFTSHCACRFAQPVECRPPWQLGRARLPVLRTSASYTTVTRSYTVPSRNRVATYEQCIRQHDDRCAATSMRFARCLMLPEREIYRDAMQQPACRSADAGTHMFVKVSHPLQIYIHTQVSTPCHVCAVMHPHGAARAHGTARGRGRTVLGTGYTYSCRVRGPSSDLTLTADRRATGGAQSGRFNLRTE